MCGTVHGCVCVCVCACSCPLPAALVTRLVSEAAVGLRLYAHTHLGSGVRCVWVCVGVVSAGGFEMCVGVVSAGGCEICVWVCVGVVSAGGCGSDQPPRRGFAAPLPRLHVRSESSESGSTVGPMSSMRTSESSVVEDVGRDFAPAGRRARAGAWARCWTGVEAVMLLVAVVCMRVREWVLVVVVVVCLLFVCCLFVVCLFVVCLFVVCLCVVCLLFVCCCCCK